MARILRSQGIYYLGKPQAVLVPSVQQQQQTIRTQLAVQARVNRQRNCAPSIEARHPWVTLIGAPATGFVRQFNRPPNPAGSSVQLAAPASSGFGTMLALVRRDATENHAVLSFTAAGPSAVAEFFISAGGGNSLSLWDGSATSQGTVTLTPAEGWALIAVTKATGSAIPRFHKCVLSTGV